MLMEQTTEFQLNKSLSVFWDTLEGENIGLRLHDCMSAACSSLLFSFGNAFKLAVVQNNTVLPFFCSLERSISFSSSLWHQPVAPHTLFGE